MYSCSVYVIYVSVTLPFTGLELHARGPLAVAAAAAAFVVVTVFVCCFSR